MLLNTSVRKLSRVFYIFLKIQKASLSELKTDEERKIYWEFFFRLHFLPHVRDENSRECSVSSKPLADKDFWFWKPSGTVSVR